MNTLYDTVQEDFSTFYRALNGTDEMKFMAKLKPTAGSLDFDVNFYGRGLYPPAAYHSEGHQDGMGVPLPVEPAIPQPCMSKATQALRLQQARFATELSRSDIRPCPASGMTCIPHKSFQI